MAGNVMKNESIKEYYCSTPRESTIKRIRRIVSQNLQKAKQLTVMTSTSETRCHRLLWITECDTQRNAHQKSGNPRNLARQHVLTKIVQKTMAMPISHRKLTHLRQNRTSLRKSAWGSDSGQRRRPTTRTRRCVARLWKWWVKWNACWINSIATVVTVELTMSVSFCSFFFNLQYL